MRGRLCPNLNHGRSHPQVRYCPECGELLDASVRARPCSSLKHARERMNRNRFCMDCGEQLIV